MLLILSAQIIIIASFSLLLDINRTVADEYADIQASPFSIQYLFRILPVFISSLFKIDFFSIIGFLLCGALILFIRIRNTMMLVLISIIAGYLFIYSFHYRSYYFVHDNQSLSVIDTLRYFTNFFPVICLFCFYVISISMEGRLKNSYVFASMVGMIVLFNLVHVFFLREDLSNIEFKERIEPVEIALSKMGPMDVIITDRPIVFKLFCAEETFVVDVTAIDSAEQLQINRMKGSKRIFVMKDEEIDTRYDNETEFFRRNHFAFVQKLSSHYDLLELK